MAEAAVPKAARTLTLAAVDHGWSVNLLHIPNDGRPYVTVTANHPDREGEVAVYWKDSDGSGYRLERVRVGLEVGRTLDEAIAVVTGAS